MVKITTDIRFDITPVEEWPEDKQADLTISLISYVDRELTIDIERALKFVDLAEQNQLWRFVGKESLAELFERRDLTLEAIEQYRRGVQLLRDKGYAGAITEEQARKAAITEAKANPLLNVGPPTKEEKANGTIGTNNRGGNTEYILRRLARDQPELLDKIESGELTVNQAAIQAGIRKKPSHNDTALKAFRRSQDRVGLLRDILSAFITEGGQQALYEVQAAVEGLRRESPKEKATKGARIDSGPLEATDKFEQVPKDKWFFLMLAKRDFLARRVAYDCRCLVEFCEEAELVYSDCGFSSAAEMIQHGYELDPVEIELAVAWLKHNQPKDKPCD